MGQRYADARPSATARRGLTLRPKTGEAYLGALELAARTGMPTGAGVSEGIVAENEPLPRPAPGDVVPDAVLHHTLKLAADQTARRQLLS